MPRPKKKLLITGVPGMGKTTLGNYLKDHYGFVHVDMECDDNIAKIVANSDAFVKDLLTKNNDIVITWGFVPNDFFINIINRLGDLNFRKIWLDGDRNAAKREFIKRDSQFGADYLAGQESALDLQMERIEESKVIEKINPKVVNTFNSAHLFREIKDIVNEIKDE